MNKFIEWYEQLVSANSFIIWNGIIIIFSFATGKIAARMMRPKITKSKYGDMVKQFSEEWEKLEASWKESFTIYAKAIMYLTLLIMLFIQFLIAILSDKHDGITTTVVMFTMAVSLMEYRDNKKIHMRMNKELCEEQTKLVSKFDEIKRNKFVDIVLDELQETGKIDEKKRKEIKQEVSL